MVLQVPTRALEAGFLGFLVLIDREEQPEHFFKDSKLKCQQGDVMPKG
jgi:hypothetical protein